MDSYTIVRFGFMSPLISLRMTCQGLDLKRDQNQHLLDGRPGEVVSGLSEMRMFPSWKPTKRVLRSPALSFWSGATFLRNACGRYARSNIIADLTSRHIHAERIALITEIWNFLGLHEKPNMAAAARARS